MSTASETEKRALDTLVPLHAASTIHMNGVNTVRAGSSSAQTQIEDSKLFSSLFDNLREAVLIPDNTGKIIRASRAATDILGMSMEALTSVHHDDPIWRAVYEDGTPVPTGDLPGVRALREKQAISGIEIGFLRPDGTPIWILESAAPILDANGEASGV